MRSITNQYCSANSLRFPVRTGITSVAARRYEQNATKQNEALCIVIMFAFCSLLLTHLSTVLTVSILRRHRHEVLIRNNGLIRLSSRISKICGCLYSKIDTSVMYEAGLKQLLLHLPGIIWLKTCCRQLYLSHSFVSGTYWFFRSIPTFPGQNTATTIFFTLNDMEH